MLTADLHICTMRFYCLTIMWSTSRPKQKYRSNAGDAISINSRRKGEEFFVLGAMQNILDISRAFLNPQNCMHKNISTLCRKISRRSEIGAHSEPPSEFICSTMSPTLRNQCFKNIYYIRRFLFISFHAALAWAREKAKIQVEHFELDVSYVSASKTRMAFNDLQLQSQEFSQFK